MDVRGVFFLLDKDGAKFLQSMMNFLVVKVKIRLRVYECRSSVFLDDLWKEKVFSQRK